MFFFRMTKEFYAQTRLLIDVPTSTIMTINKIKNTKNLCYSTENTFQKSVNNIRKNKKIAKNKQSTDVKFDICRTINKITFKETV